MTRSEKREIIIGQLSSKDNYSVEDYKGHLFFTYTYVDKLGREKIVYALLRDKSSKLSEHYNFPTFEKRSQYIESVKTDIDKDEQRTIEFNQRFAIARDLLKVGDILYSSWGYEQTNINFYKILERKNNTVVVVEIGQTKSYDRDDSGTTVPNEAVVISEPFNKRIDKYGGIKINSYSSASLYKNEKLYWSSYY